MWAWLWAFAIHRDSTMQVVIEVKEGIAGISKEQGK
jgi:hypothetical protein